jgi:hypothetical protein
MKLSALGDLPTPRLQSIIPVFLGITCFAIVCGFSAINPVNEQWLFGGGDATQHYLGWLFYRNGPWAWPPGLNPSYGPGLNNSIVFTDSIPLLAIPLKALSPVLPSTFQYFGAWALICFVLQAWFAWKLIHLFTNNILICTLGTCLFIFSVPLLSLFPENPALGSLFLILAALFLSLKESSRYPAWSWLLLLLSASLIHFYLFVIVGAIWMAALLDGICFTKSTSIKTGLTALLICIPSVLIATYLAGYFTISSIGAFGYGMFKINLLGIFNPAGWSIFLKTLYTKPHWWSEEPIYFGLGGLVLLLVATTKFSQWLTFLKDPIKKHLFLVITIFSLAIFSISNNVAIGPYEFHLPVSDQFSAVASILRNSGRMFIPAYFVLLLLACYLATKLLSKNWAIFILSTCLILQVIDLSPGWLDVRERMTSKGPFPFSQLPLKDPFWSDVSSKYKNIIVIPNKSNLQPDFMARFLSNDWRIFGRFASINQMGTNAVYLARYDEPKSLELNKEYTNALNAGNLSVKNIYIVSPEEVNTAACTNLRSKSDLFTKFDAYFVYAPEYFKDEHGLGKPEQIHPIPLRDTHSSAPYALCGTWSKSEDWGTWSDGSLAKIYIPINKVDKQSVALTFKAFASNNEKMQIVDFTSDGSNYQRIELDKSSLNQVTVQINSKMKSDGYALLEFKILKPISPKSLGIGDDDRQLGIGLTKIEFK